MDTFTLVHVLISIAGIITGFVVLYGMIAGQRMDNWTVLFLATTIATSATGFGFRFEKLLPSHIVGFISLIILGIAVYARYGRSLVGGWRNTYVITATMALYFNVFVGVVQAFRRVPALKASAPTQTEPPFVIAQVAVLVTFIVVGFLAVARFARVATTGPVRSPEC